MTVAPPDAWEPTPREPAFEGPSGWPDDSWFRDYESGDDPDGEPGDDLGDDRW